MNDTPLAIAIDGPVASGKGEIAARLARQFHLLYIYTGAMYRALALACIQAHIPFKDEPKVKTLLETITIDVVTPPVGSIYPWAVMLSGIDVTERVTRQDTAQGASDVGSLPTVRRWMVKRQQEMAHGKRVVMEGRDIGLRVLPQAQLKIYLTASVEERARRRHAQWLSKGIQKTFEQTLADTKVRDEQDMHRASDPLQKVSDAWEIDTTRMTPEQVVSAIQKQLTERHLI